MRGLVVALGSVRGVHVCVKREEVQQSTRAPGGGGKRTKQPPITGWSEDGGRSERCPFPALLNPEWLLVGSVCLRRPGIPSGLLVVSGVLGEGETFITTSSWLPFPRV